MRSIPALWPSLLTLVLAAWPATAGAEPPKTGFQSEVRVAAPTRIEWDFVATGFGPDALKLPTTFDSRKQRYQLFVPADYDAKKLWPLVVFISPGDDPLGWRYWQKVCEDKGLLFCAAYGAGNNCPPGQRTRIVLDMLDDVRRLYRIDPDQTYLTGFSGGGRMACTIAFNLPEYFGGVAPVGGTNPLPALSYLRHRAQERLSVAFVTGEKDFNRKENEEYMAPLVEELGVRSKLWVVPKLAHAIPGPEVLGEVHAWLADDLKRRQADAKARPGLSVGPDEVPTHLQQAARQVETAEAELKQPERTWRAAALLQGVGTRWGRTEAAKRARKLLDDLAADPARAKLLAEQGGAEERTVLAAQGKAFERFGDRARALKAWQQLAQLHPDTPEGKKAAEEAKRLAATPYLGLRLADDNNKVAQVVPKGPADRAGLKPGDVLVRVEKAKIGSYADLRRALENHKPGDKVTLEVQRDGKSIAVQVELASLPVPGEG